MPIESLLMDPNAKTWNPEGATEGSPSIRTFFLNLEDSPMLKTRLRLLLDILEEVPKVFCGREGREREFCGGGGEGNQ